MRPESPHGEGRRLRLLRAQAGMSGEYLRLCFCMRAGSAFVPTLLRSRCADAGHPPGLFAE